MGDAIHTTSKFGATGPAVADVSWHDQAMAVTCSKWRGSPASHSSVAW
ncbi:MAG: hypothetical protein U1F43_30935 [Myxococcota bacterium]